MKWIELKEALPKVCESVLICTDKGNICSGHLSKRYENLWNLHNQELSNETVIAWQPLAEPLIYANGADHGKKHKNWEDFTKDQEDLGDKAFIESMDHIKKTVHEYLDKDTILQEVWSAIRQGVKDYLDDFNQPVLETIIEEAVRRISLDVNVRVTKEGKE